MLLLDTHVLLWFASASRKLGPRTVRSVNRALQRGEVAVSAFTFWELGMLAQGGRVKLGVTPAEVRRGTLATGISEIAVDGDIALLSTRLAGVHPDPADRIIIATALDRDATLVTADEEILAIRQGPRLMDATR